ncbi:MAG TPA: efflux RND transporter permease subunit [Rubrobacteraceae bacterium]|nr:efflux RND transporter permease subunit [Rubrobacteraceae bacterium]
MRSIVAWCLKNKSVVILATVLLIASGAYATTQLNQELLPDIEFPAVGIATPVPGAGPDLVDEQVTQPIESAIGNISGIESTQSTSSQGFSIVLIEFNLDTDIDEAEDEIRRTLDGVSLPSQAAEPEINRQSASSFPIMNISLSTENGDLADLTEYAQDDVIPLLEEVEGTASVDLVGGAEQEIQVNLDTERLQENGLLADAVVGAISGANVNAPVGDVRIDGLSTPVRAESQINDVEALKQLPLGGAGATVGAATGGPPTGESGESSGGVLPAGAPPAGTPSEPVLLQGVAEVERGESNISGISRTNGEPSLGLNVTKDGDANTVEVSEGVREALGEVRDEIGDEQVNIIFDSAEDVEESVNGLVEKALIGAVVAVLIILLFLGSIRATLVTAVSLPTSVLAALLFSWGDNLTLNIITLAGLTIAVGRVVDDAIVVLENSYRYVQEGYEPEEAALKGTTEVASAITSSTLSTIAVFLPLGLVGGIVSEFFLPLSLTVAFALAASLIVAVTIIPVLVSVFVKRGTKQDKAPRYRTSHKSSGGGGHRWVLRVLLGVAALALASVAAAAVAVLANAVDPETLLGSTALLVIAPILGTVLAVGLVVFLFLPARREPGEETSPGRQEKRDPGQNEGWLVGIYTPALRWSLRNRAVVLVLALLVFVGGLAAIPFLAVSFFPPSEARLLVADVTFPAGTVLEDTSEELRPFEDFMLDDPGVEDYQLSAGGEDNFDPSGNRSDNTAQAFITVKEDASVDHAVDRLEEEGRDLYGRSDFLVEVQDQGPPAGGLEVTVTNGSEEELRNASEMIVNELSDNDDLTSVQSDISGGAPEVNAELNDEQAAAASLSPGSVSQTLGVLLGDGSELTLGDTPVSVGLPQGSVDTLEQVRGLPVGPGTALGDIAEVREVDAPAAISRVDGDRAVTVTGTITSPDSNTVSNQVDSTLGDLDLPGAVEASVGGESEDIAESFRNLLLSIVVAIALVYLILVVFFRSLLTPLVILLAIPLTTVGAFGALLLTGTALSVPALLGVLLLIGIVVANAILLIDFVINAEDEHETLDDAIVEAGRARLRPILMTALVTIGALTPLALGIGGGSTLISSSLAIPVIGGLATSTFLTLLVVPVGYSVLESARNRLRVKKKV